MTNAGPLDHIWQDARASPTYHDSGNTVFRLFRASEAARAVLRERMNVLNYDARFLGFESPKPLLFKEEEEEQVSFCLKRKHIRSRREGESLGKGGSLSDRIAVDSKTGRPTYFSKAPSNLPSPMKASRKPSIMPRGRSFDSYELAPSKPICPTSEQSPTTVMGIDLPSQKNTRAMSPRKKKMEKVEIPVDFTERTHSPLKLMKKVKHMERITGLHGILEIYEKDDCWQTNNEEDSKPEKSKNVSFEDEESCSGLSTAQEAIRSPIKSMKHDLQQASRRARLERQRSAPTGSKSSSAALLPLPRHLSSDSSHNSFVEEFEKDTSSSRKAPLRSRTCGVDLLVRESEALRRENPVKKTPTQEGHIKRLYKELEVATRASEHEMNLQMASNHLPLKASRRPPVESTEGDTLRNLLSELRKGCSRRPGLGRTVSDTHGGLQPTIHETDCEPQVPHPLRRAVSDGNELQRLKVQKTLHELQLDGWVFAKSHNRRPLPPLLSVFQPENRAKCQPMGNGASGTLESAESRQTLQIPSFTPHGLSLRWPPQGTPDVS